MAFELTYAVVGRVTLLMEATKHIVSQGPKSSVGQLPDEFERKPFKNSQLLAVDNLNVESAKDIVSKEALHSLAMSVGLLDVMRWKPRQVSTSRDTLADMPNRQKLTRLPYRHRNFILPVWRLS